MLREPEKADVVEFVGGRPARAREGWALHIDISNGRVTEERAGEGPRPAEPRQLEAATCQVAEALRACEQKEGGNG